MKRRAKKRWRQAQGTPPAAPAQGMAILQAAEQKIEEHLTPETRDNYLKIVVAGMHAVLDKGPNGIMASLRRQSDPIAASAQGAAGLVLILRSQSKGVMPLKAMVPAGVTLMLKALMFAQQTGLAKIGPNELDRATNIYVETIFRKLGITPQMVQNLTAKVHGLTQDPVAMEQMNRASGVVKHPLASEPTPLPGGQ